MNTRKLPTIALFILGCLFLALFGIIAWGVQTENASVHAFDMFWIDHIQAYVTSGLTATIKLLTELGNIRLIIVLTIIIAFVLFWKKRFADGLWFGGTILFCGVILTKLLKVYFDRDRPVFMQLIEKSTESFPSGHATGTTIFYGFIGLIIMFISTNLWKKMLAGLVSFLWIMFILVSRIYLGVHFPTDVLAGFCFGMASVLISVTVYSVLREPLRKLLKKFRLNDQSEMFKEQQRRITRLNR